MREGISPKNIRNFCIIAHIDHGKSTLADRFLEITKTLDKREMREQTLDSMDLEREKGITIKLKAVRMFYTPEKSETYELNLIDTPGHVDFSYEVSRSLAACEGTVLVVDATQGIEAQTLSNVYKAMEAGLTIIPVVNKIDLPSSEPEKVAKDLVSTLGFKKEDIVFVSAKTGQNTENLLREIIKRVPPPSGKEDGPFRALIFDSFFDEYLGVVALVRVVDGKISQEDTLKKEKIRFLATGVGSFPEEIGFFSPQRKKASILSAGEVGYIATGLKEIKKVRVGDTVVLDRDIPLKTETTSEALPGYKEVKPFVFLSLYPTENDKFPALREALLKLSLSDSSLSFEPESSSALGFGFRCGFLGLLHAEVVQERLEREYNLNLISSIPNVSYKVKLNEGSEVEVDSPSQMPSISEIKEIYEPWIKISIFVPTDFLGRVIELCENHRGVLKRMDYLSEKKVTLAYELPLSELILNFFDELKSVSSGFGSLDYDFLDYRPVNAVKLDILVHGEIVGPLSQIVVAESAQKYGRSVLEKLKNVIPKHQFEISLQAAISGKIIARENIPAVRKDVLKKMSGGHRERKDKLLEKQKEGKKRLKRFGKVDIPQEAFRSVLSS
ncbi:elongation factor 4 [candidate division WWE3 bacterium RIFCSPHIGHO2_01_FULL_40_23]|uniref:Elongation factor 4 n=1 Tax=candidate division WWE3 bacterium RIFCSPLOWO2_01_FULL_41_18 TaxID=1802625 RepID=A0A1F4VDL2_UNCKA|nr:MAG: elongation factor 4 [candidate division WWE3 bacterium RIFCSPHIGHO2_01_FULL_40_23]OGC55234.1 MAG: elongation factor 4 [candidate division WWE3 bacterium RIFCSPLOWO2_01_FULL_41_18]